MDSYYPIMLNISGKLCKVIGGGKVAERKVNSLLECGGEVEVISPILTRELEKYAKEGVISVKRRKYVYGDLEGSFLVFAATNDEKTNEECLRECREKDILLNIVDKPDKCNFIVPSKIQRGDLTITISTNGKSPALSKKIREELEALYSEKYIEYVNLLGEIRKRVKMEITDINKRRDIMLKIINSGIIDKYIGGKINDLKKELYDFYKKLIMD
ncbi:precorrin-2 dehydrogenase / sirohydrochlorin ferrochelatase [Caminicella sporogenes DSM 14501]|uniref:precorrin-2 dehydrogenase n=1 Tax=Caminicella sporogenes DSM 14501 TaxID=1121266 RepID=A0A1M6MSY9_9FIRM|nr:bifunctional precorrin-2 dehydrogenase/sirohydrochlorin ferrochelatase [Caminicella sporogenes]RKD22513.1 hypothetical protein BET04_05640 [Caminicella sporogenes]SHJ86618.1 precorrin-2 dehydrogenase / sirohydrochlorin ferrochelatase [Caminicella sporogenes DSM 14501]